MKKLPYAPLTTGLVLFVLGIGAGRLDLFGRTGQQEEIDRFLSRPIRISNLGPSRDEQAPWAYEYQRELHPFSITRQGKLNFVGKPLDHQERWRIDFDDGQTIVFAAGEKE